VKTPRRPKRPTVSSIEDVPELTRIHWLSLGPLIAGSVTDCGGRPLAAGLWRQGRRVTKVRDGCFVVHANWADFRKYYGAVRDEFLRLRRERHGADCRIPVAERLYQAIEAGRDPDQELELIDAEQRADDPRKVLPAA